MPQARDAIQASIDAASAVAPALRPLEVSPAVVEEVAVARAPVVASHVIAAAPAVVKSVPVAAAVAPVAVGVTSSQYHAQNELGEYSYGYAGGPSAKQEIKTFDGITRGGTD